MAEVVRNLIQNMILVWTAENGELMAAHYEQYAVGTVFLFMPVYLVFGGLWAFGIKVPKGLKQILNWAIIANAVLALLPISIPLAIAAAVVGIAYRFYRWLQPAAQQHNHRPHSRRSHAPRHDDEDEEEEE